METIFDAQGKPVPKAFQEAVTQFALEVGLDPAPLIEGDALDHDEARFWLMHYGEDDPQGITILMDRCEPANAPEAQLKMTSALLEHHVTIPSVLHGYYGYLPMLNRIVYCMRIALDEVEDGAIAIATVIANCTELARAVNSSLSNQARPPSTINDSAGGMLVLTSDQPLNAWRR